MSCLGLKIDVDTYRGMREGVPALARILDGYGLKGSFFISFGPDRSGLAVLQLLRPAFLKKMLRTNAPGLYGWKTALYGTLLPAPLIGAAVPGAVRSLAAAGHEVACHAWDHRLWQDWLFLMSRRSVERWFERLFSAYERIIGSRPCTFGAPGWLMDRRSLEIVSRYKLDYLSCTRAPAPFIFAENSMLEIPSNMPCIEEAGFEGVMRAIKVGAAGPGPRVLPVHAEVEGILYQKQFREMLDLALSSGCRICPVCEIAETLDRRSLPARRLTMGLLPGRGCKCAV